MRVKGAHLLHSRCWEYQRGDSGKLVVGALWRVKGRGCVFSFWIGHRIREDDPRPRPCHHAPRAGRGRARPTYIGVLMRNRQMMLQLAYQSADGRHNLLLITHIVAVRSIIKGRQTSQTQLLLSWSEMRNAFGLTRLMRVQEAHLLHSRCWKYHLSMHHCAP